jgi:phosphomannomutase
MLKYVFDVDGTLTPSRQVINKKFAVWFRKFCQSNHVYLVTGSDRPKTLEQIGNTIYNSCNRVYNCNGNDVWEKDVNVRNNPWKIQVSAHQTLRYWLENTQFPHLTGTHIEERPGMVNFSIVGRGANTEQRAEYVKWDKEYNERANMALYINYNDDEFKDIIATVGGETGIDIGPTGSDKSQILKDFNKNDSIIFFGDGIFDGGNDYTLAQAIKKKGIGRTHKVSGWEETYEILKNVYG